eukprot:g33235.t1
MYLLVLSGLNACLLNIANFLVTSYTSPVTLQVLGNVKSCLSIAVYQEFCTFFGLYASHGQEFLKVMAYYTPKGKGKGIDKGKFKQAAVPTRDYQYNLEERDYNDQDALLLFVLKFHFYRRKRPT